MGTIANKYSAAIFDYDGTLTPECGNSQLDSKLAKLLIELTYQHPFAICSARPFEFFRPIIDQLCRLSDQPELTRQNWYVVAENGATGHYWDPKISDYQAHYHREWPYPQNHLHNLRDQISARHSDHAGQIISNDYTIIVRPEIYKDITLIEWEQRNQDLFDQVLPTFSAHDPEQKLAMVNSGIGFIILNKTADKDHGVSQFAEYLRSHRNMPISPNAQEIIVVGDRPGLGGNDEALLSGKYGTPFSVGKDNSANIHLNYIQDSDGKIIQAAEGTQLILKTHFDQ